MRTGLRIDPGGISCQGGGGASDGKRCLTGRTRESIRNRPEGRPALRQPEEKVPVHGSPFGNPLVVVVLTTEQREECGPLRRLDPPRAEASLPAAESCSGFFWSHIRNQGYARTKTHRQEWGPEDR